jgi:undecaprenyl diphosphate synthase
MVNAPTHVALIMDGNGRWAAARGLTRNEGHRRGAATVKKILRAAKKIGIKYVTLYALSSENLLRPRSEVEFLLVLCEKFFKRYGKKFVDERVRVRTIGDLSPFPASLRAAIGKVEADTSAFDDFNLTVALNYGARSEIIHAIRNLLHDKAVDADTLSWEIFSQYLHTHDLPDPDLIIRTSGEQRLSNFLLLQAAYAELYFTTTHWPDFEEQDFLAAIEDYGHRERRMGK